MIRNAPLLDDGTPMPTRYWLVDPDLVAAGRADRVGRRRARRGSRGRPPTSSAPRTSATRAERDAALPPDHAGRGRTAASAARARGVKCLHAHYAYHLAGGDDPVGRWVARRHLRHDARRRDRHRDELDAAARRRRRRPRARRQARRPSSAGRRSRGSVRASTATARCIPTRSSARSTVLREYRRVIDELGVERVRADGDERVARRDATATTSSTRPSRCSACGPSCSRGDEEARLEFLGATAGLTEPAPYLVVDVGGGSTEFIVGTDEPEGLISIDIGCVRLTEQFLHSDPPTAEELSQAVSVVRDHLADVDRAVPGAAGREDARSAPRARCGRWPRSSSASTPRESERIHHFRLTRAAAEEVFRTLATEPIAQRRHNPGLEPGRVDVIVGGAIVVVGVHAALGLRRAARLRSRHPRRPRPRRV